MKYRFIEMIKFKIKNRIQNFLHPYYVKYLSQLQKSRISIIRTSKSTPIGKQITTPFKYFVIHFKANTLFFLDSIHSHKKILLAILNQ